MTSKNKDDAVINKIKWTGISLLIAFVLLTSLPDWATKLAPEWTEKVIENRVPLLAVAAGQLAIIGILLGIPGTTNQENRMGRLALTGAALATFNAGTISIQESLILQIITAGSCAIVLATTIPPLTIHKMKTQQSAAELRSDKIKNNSPDSERKNQLKLPRWAKSAFTASGLILLAWTMWTTLDKIDLKVRQEKPTLLQFDLKEENHHS